MYSQNDTRWKNTYLGFSKKYKLGDSGCKVTAFANWDGRTPAELNELFKKEKCFFADKTGDVCLLDDSSAAKALGWTFNGRTTYRPDKQCILEVKWNGYQHFVLLLDTGKIIDSWDGKEKSIPSKYTIVSYRLFTNLNEMDIYKDTISKSSKVIKFDYGDNLNEKEADEYIDEINALVKKVDQQQKDIDQFQIEYKQLETTNKRLLENNTTLQVRLDAAEELRAKMENEIQILKETVDEFENEQGKTINSFSLGKWLIIIKEKK